MAESIDAFAELTKVRIEVEEVGTMVDALVRDSAVKDEILLEMNTDEGLSQIYRLIDGERSQNDILTALKSAGVRGASAATVSRKLLRCKDLGLIVFDHRQGNSMVYRHSRLDRVLGISRRLRTPKSRKRGE